MTKPDGFKFEALSMVRDGSESTLTIHFLITVYGNSSGYSRETIKNEKSML